jgi:hypothetical protein
MHPFGGTPICPRCDKSVYAAEQTMGPGRKLYHKPCLACTICNKRLDSYTLLEHDQKPYCKSCHVKNFGTHDLRQANLPHRQDAPQSPNSTPLGLPSSPAKSSPFPPGRFIASPSPAIRSPSPIQTQRTGATTTKASRTTSPLPILKPNRALSPISSTFPNRRDITPTAESDEILEAEEKEDTVDETEFSNDSPPTSPVFTNTSTNSGRGVTGFPRTVPLSPSKAKHSSTTTDGASRSPAQYPAVTIGRPVSSSDKVVTTTPLKQTSTGTRYGAALGGATPSPARQWGGTTPQCPRCGKSVYFAEQVKATGKTWHKGCLRCIECSTLLDSKRLTEKDGDPLCHRCYGKLYGPEGGGYALLGKAGA